MVNKVNLDFEKKNNDDDPLDHSVLVKTPRGEVIAKAGKY
jgi:hypothetical protein